ncbi:MAG: D-alanyl-D-alanine carboxypeptidase [Ruminiclostridium sp.]|nr:D-alanyl-D-alanine carboxypeptidase [Ruminiclostridium sp.]
MRINKLRAVWVITAAAVLSCIFAPQARAEGRTVTADIKSAKAAILTESSTGMALCGLNENTRLPIASVTKIMTLLIAAEEIESGALSFSDTAVCSEHANSMDGSVIWLETGEEMSVGDLAKSIVIASANDACVMLAEHIAGSEEAFVERMNAKAAELGMTNTHFVNCVGYDDERHYSTARDIAVMAAELRRYDIYDEFLMTRLDSVRTGTPRETQLLNTNKLITSYSGITGLKTGTTDAAGCCFAATAKRGNMELTAVVLGCDSDTDRFAAARALLDLGFDGYERVTPRPDVSELLEVPVEGGVKRGVDTRFAGVPELILPKGSGSKIKYSYSRPAAIEAPVEKGQVLGFVTMTVDGSIIGNAKIIAAEEVARLDFSRCLGYILNALFGF